MTKFGPTEGVGFIVQGLEEMIEDGFVAGHCHFIKEIKENSPVSIDGNLQIGDEVLSVRVTVLVLISDIFSKI